MTRSYPKGKTFSPRKTVPVEFERPKAESFPILSPASQEAPSVPGSFTIAESQPKAGEEIEEGHFEGPA